MPALNTTWTADRYTTYVVVALCGESVKVWWIEGKAERLLSARFFLAGTFAAV